MNKLKVYMITYSLSNSVYDRNKDGNNVPKIWNKKQGTFETLKEDILNGFSICGAVFHKNERKQSNFIQSSTVILDCDEMEMTFQDFCEKFKPSFCYTTANNGIDKHNKGISNVYRYRAIFEMSDVISDGETYVQCAKYLKSLISKYDKNILNDNSDLDYSHFFAGNTNAEVFTSSTSYSPYTISLCYNSHKDEIDSLFSSSNASSEGVVISHSHYSIQGGCNINGNEKNRKNDHPSELDADLKSDMKSGMTYGELLDKWIKVYPIVENTGYEFKDGELYTMLGSDYEEVQRYFITTFSSRLDKTIICPKIYKDGEGRKRYIFTIMLMKFHIKPDMSFSQLFINALYEMYHFTDYRAAEDRITVKHLLNICKDVMSGRYKKSGKRRLYKVNTNLIKSEGGNVRTVCNKVNNAIRTERKLKKYEEIAKYYRPDWTLKENADMLADMGIAVSRSFLGRFKKWFNSEGVVISHSHYSIQGEAILMGMRKIAKMTTPLTKAEKEEIMEAMYDESKTNAEMIQILEDNGVKISDRTYRRWKQKHNGSRKEQEQSENSEQAAMVSERHSKSEYNTDFGMIADMVYDGETLEDMCIVFSDSSSYSFNYAVCV